MTWWGQILAFLVLLGLFALVLWQPMWFTAPAMQITYWYGKWAGRTIERESRRENVRTWPRNQ